MSLYQKVYLRIVGILGDTPTDQDQLPDRILATGTWYLKPNIKEGSADAVLYSDNVVELEIPRPISGDIINGYINYGGKNYVWLKVDPNGWNWNISFPQLRINNVPVKLDSWNFELEPATEEQVTNGQLVDTDPSYYVGYNLAPTIEYVTAATGTKVTKGEQGDSVVAVQIVDDDSFQFITDNPDPLKRNLPPVTVPQMQQSIDAAAAAAASEAIVTAAASAAAASETAAASSAGTATTKASEAATSATTATTKAGEASTSAGTATTAAGTATTAAGTATTKAGEAATSASSAAASASAVAADRSAVTDLAAIAGAAAETAVDTASKIIVSSTAPSSPVVGQIWIDTGA